MHLEHNSFVFRHLHCYAMSSSEDSADEGGISEHVSSRESSDHEEPPEEVLESSTDEDQKKPKKHKKTKLSNKYIDVESHNVQLKKQKVKHNKKISCRTVVNPTKPYNKTDNTLAAERSSIIKRTVTFPAKTFRGQILLKQEGLNLRIIDIYNGPCKVVSKSSKELVVSSEL